MHVSGLCPTLVGKPLATTPQALALFFTLPARQEAPQGLPSLSLVTLLGHVHRAGDTLHATEE